MKKTVNTIFYTLLIFMTMLSGSFCFSLLKEKKESLLQFRIKENSYNSFIETVIEKEIAQYKLSDLSLQGDSVLIDSLASLVQKNKFLFIFKFDEFSCDVCIKEAFSILDQYENLRKNEKFYIIVSYQDERKFKILNNMYKEKYNIINIKYNDKLYLLDYNKDVPPMFFILNNEKHLTPKKLFLFFKEIPDINRKYLDIINSFF